MAESCKKSLARTPSNPKLTQEDIIRQVSHNVRDHDVRRGRISKYYTGTYRANAVNEDTFDVQTSLLTDSGALFGVFDGHSGTGASYFCRDELFRYLQEYRRMGQTSSLIHKAPFVDADKHFLALSFDDQCYADGLSGACACVAHVFDDTISVANLGDCRAFVGRRQNRIGRAVHQVISLSVDHSIDNPAERERLLASHSNEV